MLSKLSISFKIWLFVWRKSNYPYILSKRVACAYIRFYMREWQAPKSSPSGKQFSFVQPHKARFLRSLSIYFGMAAAVCIALHEPRKARLKDLKERWFKKAKGAAAASCTVFLHNALFSFAHCMRFNATFSFYFIQGKGA